MIGSAIPSDELAARTVEHLRALVRCDTSNPPGNETLAARYVAQVLREAGVGAEVIEPTPGRGSVVARLRARVAAPEPALLLHAHLDVVAARAADGWTHAPFGGEVADGCVWGRGALDHKAAVAMNLAALLAMMHASGRLRRDVIFAATADEEQGGFMGAGWLVEHRTALLDATYCIGEGGGYNAYLGNRRAYPCSIAEKGSCRLRLTARGPAGHGAMPMPENAILVLAEALQRVAAPLPFHHVAAVDDFLSGLGRVAGSAQGAFLSGLGHSGRGSLLLQRMARGNNATTRALARQVNPLLRNTVSPTVVQAGIANNVIPAEASATLDGRFLPGQSPEALVAELRDALGPQLARLITIEVDHTLPAVAMPWASPLAETIVRVMDRHDPGAPVLPYMLAAVTDAKHLTRLPSLRHYYGFNPLRTQRDFPLLEQLHGVDERVPIEALDFGVHALTDILCDFCLTEN